MDRKNYILWIRFLNRTYNVANRKFTLLSSGFQQVLTYIIVYVKESRNISNEVNCLNSFVRGIGKYLVRGIRRESSWTSAWSTNKLGHLAFSQGYPSTDPLIFALKALALNWSKLTLRHGGVCLSFLKDASNSFLSVTNKWHLVKKFRGICRIKERSFKRSIKKSFSYRRGVNSSC